MNQILIRADGAKSLGMGHLNRCYLLAHYLQNKYNVKVMLLTKDNIATRSFLSNKRQSIETIYLKSQCSHQDEFDVIYDFIHNKNTTLLLLDLLEVETESSYLKIFERIDIPICVISDDSHYHEFPVSLIINGNPNQLPDSYSKLKERYLIGPKYFIMDEWYSKPIKKHKNSSNVLVSLGGSDHNDILFIVLKSLIRSNYVDKIVVISSKSTGYIDRLEKLALDIKSIEIELHFDVESLSSFWNTCGLAITAGGNTLFERIASGVPGATVCQLPRQMEIANSFENLNVNVNFGFGPSLSEDKLCILINNFLKNDRCHSLQRKLSKDIVPGNGLKLCSQQIVKLI